MLKWILNATFTVGEGRIQGVRDRSTERDIISGCFCADGRAESARPSAAGRALHGLLSSFCLSYAVYYAMGSGGIAEQVHHVFWLVVCLRSRHLLPWADTCAETAF